MSRPDASQAYREALRQQGLGQVWRSDNPEISDYVFAFHTFSGEPYNEALPKRRRNDRGQAFSTEFQFLAGDEIPNAFAFCGPGDGLFVGMTASMFGLVNRVYRRVFADG